MNNIHQKSSGVNSILRREPDRSPPSQVLHSIHRQGGTAEGLLITAFKLKNPFVINILNSLQGVDKYV